LEIETLDGGQHRPAFLCRWIAHHCPPDARKASECPNRVFELRVYHAVPGKLPALKSRVRDTTSKLLAKHDLKVVGDWVPEGAPEWDNTFVDILAHPGRQEVKKNWDAMMPDPEFQEVIKSGPANKLVEQTDSTYMRPTDFSPLK
jgi:hypothetical protein